MESASLSSRADQRQPGVEAMVRPTDRAFYIIGLLGGIASGKSTVAAELRRLGAGLLDADRAGHEALRLPAVMQAIRNRWGDEVFNPAGEVERSAIARIVFAPTKAAPAELRFLEQLTHPEIGRLLAEQARVIAGGTAPAVVLDAPVMMKAGWDEYCDRIVFVDAPHPVRLARALERGWSQEDFDRREAAQEALDEKRSRADMIIDNSTSKASTERQVQQFWHTLVDRKPAIANPSAWPDTKTIHQK
jgi:dephospho-CoA kinase